MLTQIINGKIFTPQGWLDEGSVLMRDNKILEVTAQFENLGELVKNTIFVA